MGGEDTTSGSKKLVDILNSVTGDKIGEPVELTDEELKILHKNADKDAGGFVRWNSETIGIIRKILKGKIKTIAIDNNEISYQDYALTITKTDDDYYIALVAQPGKCTFRNVLDLRLTINGLFLGHPSYNLETAITLTEGPDNIELLNSNSTNIKSISYCIYEAVPDVRNVRIIELQDYTLIEGKMNIQESFTVFEHVYWLSKSFKVLCEENPDIFLKSSAEFYQKLGQIRDKVIKI